MRHPIIGLACVALVIVAGACGESATNPDRAHVPHAGAARLRADSTATPTAATNTVDTQPDSLGENGRNGSGFIGSGH